MTFGKAVEKASEKLEVSVEDIATLFRQRASDILLKGDWFFFVEDNNIHLRKGKIIFTLGFSECKKIDLETGKWSLLRQLSLKKDYAERDASIFVR